jgi:hypothetical protein
MGGNFHLLTGAAGFKPIINLVLHVLFTHLIFPAIFYPVSAGPVFEPSNLRYSGNYSSNFATSIGRIFA